METFVPNVKSYEQILYQHGGSIDRYIYHQTGQGLGNFFSKVARIAKPLLFGAINTAAPELRVIGKNLVDAGSKAALSKIETIGRDKTKIKRRKDNLDE